MKCNLHHLTSSPRYSKRCISWLNLSNKKMKGNIYVPESTNIRRGKAFFDEFLNVKYEDVDSYMRNLSESPENIKAFDDLYKKIMSL